MKSFNPNDNAFDSDETIDSYLDFVIINWCIFYIDIFGMAQQQEFHYINILKLYKKRKWMKNVKRVKHGQDLHLPEKDRKKKILIWRNITSIFNSFQVNVACITEQHYTLRFSSLVYGLCTNLSFLSYFFAFGTPTFIIRRWTNDHYKNILYCYQQIGNLYNFARFDWSFNKSILLKNVLP